MIVVGSHGESPLKGAIVGSTPYKLVHFSRRPCSWSSGPCDERTSTSARRAIRA